MNHKITQKKNAIYVNFVICLIGILLTNSAMARGRSGPSKSRRSWATSESSECRGFKHGPRDPQAIFDRLDENDDGVISLEEFKKPDEHFALIDTDDSGELSFKEFETAPVILAIHKMDDNLDGVISAAEFRGSEEKFEAIDKSGDRLLTSEELEAAVGEVRLHFARKTLGFLNRVDEDGDGAISRDEFKGSDAKFESKDLDANGFITREEVEESFAGRLLDKSDKDGDGVISPAEFIGTDERFNYLDEDSNGILSFEEILSAFN